MVQNSKGTKRYNMKNMPMPVLSATQLSCPESTMVTSFSNKINFYSVSVLIMLQF